MKREKVTALPVIPTTLAHSSYLKTTATHPFSSANGAVDMWAHFQWPIKQSHDQGLVSTVYRSPVTVEGQTFDLFTASKMQGPALAGVAQWAEHRATNQSVACSIPSQDTCLGCGPGPQWGARERQPHIDVSLPSPLSKDK